MKKSLISVVGGSLVLLGLIFVVVPGPSLIFIIPGLVILSFEYPLAEVWLRKCMRQSRRVAQWIDRKILQRKYQ